MASTQSRYQFTISSLERTQEDPKSHSQQEDRNPRKQTNETRWHPLKPGPPKQSGILRGSPLKKCSPLECPGDSDLLVVPVHGCQPPIEQRDLYTPKCRRPRARARAAPNRVRAQAPQPVKEKGRKGKRSTRALAA